MIYLFAILAAASLVEEAPPEPRSTTCTYKTYQWSVVEKRAVNRRSVTRDRADLTDEEKAPDFEVSGCTVCNEDQVEVAVEGMPPVRVCYYYADKVKKALEQIRDSGTFKVKTLTGYRVGQTRGKAVDGKRTQFSNHSYGTAIDVNRAANGLYRSCRLEKGPRKAAEIKRCRRGIGGTWNPGKRPRTTVTPDSEVYRAFRDLVGWKWGGEIEGRTKDFMHFSPDGF